MNNPLALISFIARDFSHWDRQELISAGALGFAQARADHPEIPLSACSIWIKGAMVGAVQRWNQSRSYPFKTVSYNSTTFSRRDNRSLVPPMLRDDPGISLEQQEKIHAALARLSARLRFIVDQHYFEEIPLGGIARGLRIDLRTAQALHTRALHQLREVLSHDHAFVTPDRLRATARLHAHGSQRERRRAVYLRRKGEDRGAAPPHDDRKE